MTTETSQSGSGRFSAFVPVLLFAVLLIVFAITLIKIGSNRLDIREIKSPLIGKPVPAFDLPSLNQPGARVSNAGLSGRAYVVNVWGTWCPECRAEHETLLRIAKDGQVSLIGIDWSDDAQLAQRWLQQLGNPYEQVASDVEGQAAVDFGVYGAPETFLVSADGVVLHKHLGALSWEDWQKEFVPLMVAAAKPVAGSSL